MVVKSRCDNRPDKVRIVWARAQFVEKPEMTERRWISGEQKVFKCSQVNCGHDQWFSLSREVSHWLEGVGLGNWAWVILKGRNITAYHHISVRLIKNRDVGPSVSSRRGLTRNLYWTEDWNHAPTRTEGKRSVSEERILVFPKQDCCTYDSSGTNYSWDS